MPRNPPPPPKSNRPKANPAPPDTKAPPCKGCGDCGGSHADPSLSAKALDKALEGKVDKPVASRMEVPKTWNFGEGVAGHFDQHVRAQLPFYDDVSELVAFFANQFMPRDGMMYDIGCSTGNITSRIRDALQAKNAQVVGIDCEPAMEKHFHGYGHFVVADAGKYAYTPFDVAVSMLTLGFIPVSERAGMLNRLYSNILPGGAILMVEKATPRFPLSQELMRRATMYFKQRQGEKAEDVLRKEYSLGGILRSLDVDLFQAAEVPNSRIESFFQFGEFAGWIIYGPPA